MCYTNFSKGFFHELPSQVKTKRNNNYDSAPGMVNQQHSAGQHLSTTWYCHFLVIFPSGMVSNHLCHLCLTHLLIL